MILSNELIDENPSLALTWIDAYDWRFFHLDLNTLPSTKYWWWFYMKYFQEDKYKWESNWDEEKIAKDFQDDFLIEKPGGQLLTETYLNTQNFLKTFF